MEMGERERKGEDQRFSHYAFIENYKIDGSLRAL